MKIGRVQHCVAASNNAWCTNHLLKRCVRDSRKKRYQMRFGRVVVMLCSEGLASSKWDTRRREFMAEVSCVL